jgi:hypothetical protein
MRCGRVRRGNDVLFATNTLHSLTYARNTTLFSVEYIISFLSIIDIQPAEYWDYRISLQDR